jgi:hypothetical protein
MSDPTEPVTEPAESVSDLRELLLGHLDFHRAAVVRKLEGLPEAELRGSRLPSGWSPLGLLKHLAYVERRWMRWGFAGEPIERVFGDRDPDTGVFHVGGSESVADITAEYVDECARSRNIVERAELSDLAASGGGWTESEERPALAWILFHLLSEYARHVGQLDVARELADGATGE